MEKILNVDITKDVNCGLVKKIVWDFIAEQCCDEDDAKPEGETLFDYYVRSDEFTPLVSYKYLEASLGISRDYLKPVMLQLRNMGFISLNVGVDVDYIPSGSGWQLTEKGLKLANCVANDQDITKILYA